MTTEKWIEVKCETRDNILEVSFNPLYVGEYALLYKW